MVDHGRFQGEQGSQAIELALSMPIVVLVSMFVMVVGQVVLGVAGTHQMAAAAARLAAVSTDEQVRAGLRDVDGVDVRLDPPSGVRAVGDMVTVTITRPLPVGLLRGVDPTVTVHATHRTEDVP